MTVNYQPAYKLDTKDIIFMPTIEIVIFRMC
jgi:hypothetical protein